MDAIKIRGVQKSGKRFLFSLVLLQFFSHCLGLYCLDCGFVTNPLHCNKVKLCGPHEFCYNDIIVTDNGRIGHRMGCRDSLQCHVPLNGRRSDTTVCSECCSTAGCQTTLCRGQDDKSLRGPLCFHCNRHADELCSTVSICGRDEECVISLDHQGCVYTQECERMSAILGKRNVLSIAKCFHCCSGDFCNNNCTGVAPPCRDSTGSDTCRLATSIVCKDLVHATNAGCRHFCGFC